MAKTTGEEVVAGHITGGGESLCVLVFAGNGGKDGVKLSAKVGCLE